MKKDLSITIFTRSTTFILRHLWAHKVNIMPHTIKNIVTDSKLQSLNLVVFCKHCKILERKRKHYFQTIHIYKNFITEFLIYIFYSEQI